MKQCSKCKTRLSLTKFYKNRLTKDGLGPWCQSCIKVYSKVWRETNREREKARSAAWHKANRGKKKAHDKLYHQTPKGRFSNYKSNAKTRGRLFNLTLEQFTKLTSKSCYYCGASALNQEGSKRSNGIDRVDNSKGYEMDNVVPSCRGCNLMKGKMSVDKFLKHCGRVSLWVQGCYSQESKLILSGTREYSAGIASHSRNAKEV